MVSFSVDFVAFQTFDRRSHSWVTSVRPLSDQAQRLNKPARHHARHCTYLFFTSQEMPDRHWILLSREKLLKWWSKNRQVHMHTTMTSSKLPLLIRIRTYCWLCRNQLWAWEEQEIKNRALAPGVVKFKNGLKYVTLIRPATKSLYWNLIKTTIWYLMSRDGDTALPRYGLCYKIVHKWTILVRD